MWAVSPAHGIESAKRIAAEAAVEFVHGQHEAPLAALLFGSSHGGRHWLGGHTKPKSSGLRQMRWQKGWSDSLSGPSHTFSHLFQQLVLQAGQHVGLGASHFATQRSCGFGSHTILHAGQPCDGQWYFGQSTLHSGGGQWMVQDAHCLWHFM